MSSNNLPSVNGGSFDASGKTRKSKIKMRILEPRLTPSGLFDSGDFQVPVVPDLLADHHVDNSWQPIDNFSHATDVVDVPDSTPVDNASPDLFPISTLPFNPVTNFDLGVFTVGETGRVSVDFLYDGGHYQGQLAIFSLSGMESFDPDSNAFSHEAATRALSNSNLGHILIDDLSQAAHFASGDNSGQYLGEKTFEMRAGDHFGMMLVPNGTVQTVFDTPDVDGDVRPLFSLATANPADAYQVGQITDVFGDGKTFVFEDLRIDNGSDKDFNDLVFHVKGATGQAATFDQLIADGLLDPQKDWRDGELGQMISDYIPKSNQPLIGVIDTGFAANNPDIDYSRITLGTDYIGNDANPLLQAGEGSEHGTHVLGIIGATQDNGIGIDGINDDAPIWLGRAVGSGEWANSLTEFINHSIADGRDNAVVNLSMDLTQVNPDGSVTTRYEFTPQERAALEFARQNNVLIVVAAGNDGGTMSALGQASQEFDNIITVGAIDYSDNRAIYSSFGYGLDLVDYGGTDEYPIMSTVGNANDLPKLVEGLGIQAFLGYMPNQSSTRNTSNSEDLFLNEKDGFLQDDEMAVIARTTFEEAFGSFEDFDEKDLDSLTPEERKVYKEATQEVDQLLSEYLGAASQKLALEYMDGYYKTQIDALTQFVDVFDENVADTLVNAQTILKEAGYSVQIPSGDVSPDISLNLGFGMMSGTSIATAKVTGAVSQVWAANPNLSYVQVKEILKHTATDLNTTGWDKETGSGKTNLTAAVELAKNTQAQPYQPKALLSPLIWSGEGKLIPDERPVSTSVPAFTGRVMNVGYVSTLGYQRVRSAPSTTASQVGIKYPGQLVTFDAYENNGGWYTDPVVGGSNRWYHIAGTGQWMWAGYIDNSPEQAEQERQRLEALRRAEEEARRAEEELRRAEEEARRAEEELKRIEEQERLRIEQERQYQEYLRLLALEEQRRKQEQLQALVSEITQKYGDPGTFIRIWTSNGVTVYQFTNGELFVQPDGRLYYYENNQFYDAEKAKLKALKSLGTTVNFIDKNIVDPAGFFRTLDKLSPAGKYLSASFVIEKAAYTREFFAKGPGKQVSKILEPIGLWLEKDLIKVGGKSVLKVGPAINLAFVVGDLVTAQTEEEKRRAQIKAGATLIGAGIGGIFGGVAGAAAGGVGAVPGAVGGALAFGSIVAGSVDLVYGAADLLGFGDDLDNVIGSGYKFVGDGFNSVVEAAKQKAQEASQKAQEFANKAKVAYEQAQRTVQQTQQTYQTFKQEIQQRSTQIVQQSQKKMQEIAQSIAQKVVNSPIGKYVANYAKKAVQAISNVINGAKQFVSNVIETGKQIVNNVINEVKQTYETVKNFVVNTASTTYNNAVQAVNNVANNISSGFNGFKKVFGW